MTTPLPDWVKIGDRVACYTPQKSWGDNSVVYSKIAKIGKRDIVLENGNRFNRKRMCFRVGGQWGNITYLLSVEDPQVIRAHAGDLRRSTQRSVEELLESWVNNEDPKDALGAIHAIRAALKQISRQELGLRVEQQ